LYLYLNSETKASELASVLEQFQVLTLANIWSEQQDESPYDTLRFQCHHQSWDSSVSIVNRLDD